MSDSAGGLLLVLVGLLCIGAALWIMGVPLVALGCAALLVLGFGLVVIGWLVAQ